MKTSTPNLYTTADTNETIDLNTDHFFTVSSIDGVFRTSKGAVDAWYAAHCPVPKASSVWMSEHNSPNGPQPTKTLSMCVSMTRDVLLEPPCKPWCRR